MTKIFNVDKKQPVQTLGRTFENFKITLSNKNKRMTKKDIQDLIKKAEKQKLDQGYERVRILIRADNGHKIRTLKGYDQTLEDMDDREYYNAHVKNADKFTKYDMVQMTIQYMTPAKEITSFFH